jgi:hypothetical protein
MLLRNKIFFLCAREVNTMTHTYEADVVARLIEREQMAALREVSAGGAGFVDILTPTEIIEVKEVHSWKHALGQVLAYKAALNDPKRTPRIHLFRRNGEYMTYEDVELVCKVCETLGVRVTFEGQAYVVEYKNRDRSLEWLDKYKFVPCGGHCGKLRL